MRNSFLMDEASLSVSENVHKSKITRYIWIKSLLLFVKSKAVSIARIEKRQRADEL